MMPQTLSRPDPTSNLNQPKLRGWTGLRRALFSGLLVLGAFAPVQGVGAEGSIDLIRQEAGFRGALLAHDPSLPRRIAAGHQDPRLSVRRAGRLSGLPGARGLVLPRSRSVAPSPG